MMEKVSIGSGQFGCIFGNIKEVACVRFCLFPSHVFWEFIKHFSNVIDHREIYFTRKVVVDGHPKVLMDITPCDGHFCNISIFCIKSSKNARNNVGINMRRFQVINIPEYGALFSFGNFFHHKPIIFVSLVAHFSRLLESFSKKSSDASRVMYIVFLDSAYMNFLPRLYRQMQ